MAIFLALGLFRVETLPAGERVSLTDQVGRTIVCPANPMRVVSLAPSITEIVFALGREDILVGATIYSDHPEAAKAVPRVGSYIHLDLEKIVALKPDLCIAVKDGNPKETAQRLENLGIPVFAVNPVDLSTVMAAVTHIGKALGAEEQAAAIVHDMNTRIKKLEERIAHVTHRPRVFFQIGISPIVSCGRDTFIHGLIQRAGGNNLADKSLSYPRFTMEQVIILDPEVIIITSMARQGIFEQVKKEWESWPGISAVRNGRVYVLDSDILDRPSPRMAAGLEQLARQIHPEVFTR